MQILDRSSFWIPFACSVLLASAVGAQETAPAPPISEAERTAIAAAADLGGLIFLHDRAAWIGTDQVRKINGFDKDNRLRGYVTERRDDQIRVTFYGAEKGEADTALYRVVVPQTGTPYPAEKLGDPEPLSSYEANAVSARAVALGARFEPACSRQYNTVVLPATVGGEQGWAVYLLPGTTDAQVFPVGGAHRVEVNAAGDRIVNRRAYTTSCLSLDNNPQAEVLVLSHLLDPQPTELHMFWSLQIRKPLAVITLPAGSIWMVSGREGIALIERGTASGGK
jgi:hypothetical protein